MAFKVFWFLCLLIFDGISFGQEQFNLKIFVSAANNEGFIEEATVRIKDKLKLQTHTLITDQFGYTQCYLERGKEFQITIYKEMFFDVSLDIMPDETERYEQVFKKIEMRPKPGYRFELSLTEQKIKHELHVEGITHAFIEVYNNTKHFLKDSFTNLRPNFTLNLEKDNHYTILIRKDGYYAKQMEVYLGVNNCIICFEGLNKMQPVNRMIEDNNIGYFSGSIEMERYYLGEKLIFNNISFDYNKFEIPKNASNELDLMARIILFNPQAFFEIGSHCDSWGSDLYNFQLSEKRAEAIVNYLLSNRYIEKDKISFKGYGETELLNKCRNNVKCDDSDHKINRRVELKLIGFAEKEAVNNVSLSDFKLNEKSKSENEAHMDKSAEKRMTIDQGNSDNPLIEAIVADHEYSSKIESQNLSVPINVNNSKYLIIAGSFRARSNAEKVAERIKNLGFFSTIEELTIPGINNVIVGKYGSEKEARIVLSKLRNLNVDSYIFEQN